MGHGHWDHTTGRQMSPFLMEMPRSNSPSFKRFFQSGCWDGVGVSKGSKLLSHNTEILENQETKDLGTGFLLFTFERDRI